MWDREDSGLPTALATAQQEGESANRIWEQMPVLPRKVCACKARTPLLCQGHQDSPLEEEETIQGSVSSLRRARCNIICGGSWARATSVDGTSTWDPHSYPFISLLGAGPISTAKQGQPCTTSLVLPPLYCRQVAKPALKFQGLCDSSSWPVGPNG